ncbi:MAG: pilus assembly protein CpaE [Microlunatus sp.]|nr:pilus assembly protein CpaE [Microlunatus sp.]MDN5770310.1 pilus assembly protein CpaE [Microlunatus sp.]MDN5803272.1 pilus assembly protein CpaE [Microlunatus sp.]
MISRELARELAPHLTWRPQNGDQFFIPRPEISEQVFTVSDMVVEVISRGGDTRFHFNGTVEWALDSVEVAEVVWLPREEQLRSRLGSHFLSMDADPGGFVVALSGPGRAHHTAPAADASDAYAHALLYVVSHEAIAAR